MIADTVKLRPVQQRLIDAIDNKIALSQDEEGPIVLVADMFPGTGKTLGYQYILNSLYRRGLIDTAAIFTPRLNLCGQCETDWKADKTMFIPPVMGELNHRDNSGPLLREDQFGYVSTYASLVSRPDLHLSLFKEFSGRIALVLDEAQQLGTEDRSGINTQSANIVKQLGPHAAFIVVLSGTPYRADDRPLLFASYTEPDEIGVRYLQADVTATYLEGVAQGYLRPFEYELVNGQALYEYLDGEQEDLVLSSMNGGLKKVLEEAGYWQPLVDKTVETVREVQAIDKRFCGLIGANSQRHAEKIISYLEAKYKGIRVLLAVSDEKLAQDNLRRFKTGGYDILVTVAMAHVGYDHKSIVVVTALNSYREDGWLDQFFGRGLRMMPDIPMELQILRAIVPDDRKMATYVDRKRKEGQQGLRERGTGPGPGIVEPRLGATIWAQPGETRAMGMNPDADLEPPDFAYINGVVQEYALGPVVKTNLGRLVANLTNGLPVNIGSEDSQPIQPTSNRVGKTKKEWEKLLRQQIQKQACKVDSLMGWNFGETAYCIKSQTGQGSPELGLEALKARLHWIETEWLPQAEAYNASQKS